ncbi:MAG: NB-ARC domain-containing protein, partial [Cyanobacteria bacterium J06636_27]
HSKPLLTDKHSAMVLEGESVFNGTAQNLINHRIPAVVAMQYSVSVNAATEFAKQFYRSLGQKNSLAMAISQGREAMGVEGNQWYRPVLYLRWKDNQGGQLFDLPKSTVRIGVPFQAPPLPTYYVDRPEYTQDLKTRLLTESSDVRTLVVTAIHGLGSVGKSTLAAALAHDEEVQAHYCDGILWATLGQQPNLLNVLSGWLQALLGDYKFEATSEEAASNQLRTLLRDKAVLLVVDDAWNTEDAKKFNFGGARCQVLVTTRETAIAKVLGASTYSLDVMQPEQAMELLTKKLGRNFADTETEEAEALAKAVGYLPLALELAAAQVAGGTSWNVLVQDMQQEIARLKTLNAPEARDVLDEADLKHLSLTASLNLSVKRLPDEVRENFIWLGTLPENVNITQKMTTTLWDLDDERDAASELRYLQSKALLLSGISLLDGTPAYRLHSLFHDLALNLLTTSPNPRRKGNLPGLGITLPKAHATFLEKYRNLTDKNLWHTLPNDGYIHQHLVWHLEKAGWINEIHELLREETKERRNGWYETCEKLGKTAVFVSNIIDAWRLAEEMFEQNCSESVALQFRYALIITSLNSLAVNIPENLLILLVEKRVWSSEQALTYLRQNQDLQVRAKSVIKLSDFLPQILKKQALLTVLDETKEIRNEEYRAQILCYLVAKLPSDLLCKVFEKTKEIRNEEYRVQVLCALAAQSPPDLLYKIFDEVEDKRIGIGFDFSP